MKWYRNWPFHNLVAHPGMQLLQWLSVIYPPADAWAVLLHDRTCPYDGDR